MQYSQVEKIALITCILQKETIALISIILVSLIRALLTFTQQFFRGEQRRLPSIF